MSGPPRSSASAEPQGPARPSRRWAATLDDHGACRRNRLCRSPHYRCRRTRRMDAAGRQPQDLTLYLETFAHTVGVMQTAPAIERVARECAEDLATDGVVYAEIRFAPELHTERGLSLDAVIERSYRLRGRASGTDLTIRIICSAMRHLDRGLEVARRPSAIAITVLSASTSPAPKRFHPTTTCWRFSTANERTSTSRSTPVRPTGPGRSGRRCSTAVPNGWAMASVLSRTGPPRPAARPARPIEPLPA